MGGAQKECIFTGKLTILGVKAQNSYYYSDLK